MFITLEGIEGSGKSSLIKLLADFFTQCNYSFITTFEPGDNHLGKKLEKILLNDSVIDPKSELFLFLADRSQHVKEVIVPALKNGITVLCDRYKDSTIVYQGYGRGLDINLLETMCKFSATLEPDLTLLLDLPVETGLMRVAQRKIDAQRDFDRFDGEKYDFHVKIRNGYLRMAKIHPERIKIINASLTLQEVFSESLKIIFTKMAVKNL